MADESKETPPQGNKRLNLQERANRMKKQQSGGFSGFVWFTLKTITLAAVVFGGAYLYHQVTKPVERANAEEPLTIARKPEGTGGPEKTVPTTFPKTEPEDLAAFEKRMEFETVQGLQRQKLALAKLKQRQVIDLGGSVLKALDEWKAELVKWESEVTPLLEEDSGKQLATNKPLLKRFRAVYQLERPGKDEEERLRSQTEGVISAVKLANDNPSDGSLPPEPVTTELQGLLRQGKEGRDRYRTAREQITAIVRQAKSGQAGTPGATGTKTLAEASSEQQEEEQLASAAVIEAERMRSEEAATASVAKVKADQVREMGLKEEARVLSETKSLKAKADSDRIRRLAEDPAIQNQFAPFLAKGKWQYNYGLTGDIPEPASYKTLVGMGHLRDVKTFARAMAGYGNFGLNELGNDRPHVPYPSTQEGMKQTEKLFEQFKELAPTWIQMGKLLP